jgi:hypothetical protein
MPEYGKRAGKVSREALTRALTELTLHINGALLGKTL